jgi:Fur family transcriptional regulator, ferric uptake regulator
MTQDWERRLRDHGFRITPQRQLVLEAVENLRHGTPEEILVEVQLTASGVNLSTIYRTLEVLEEVGLVTHAHIGHGPPTYHAVDEDVHIHLVCDRCGAVQSVPAGVAAEFVERLESEYGFRTDISHVSVHGLCESCKDRVFEPEADDPL